MFLWDVNDKCNCQEICNQCVTCFGPTLRGTNSYCCNSADNGYLNVCIANCFAMSPDVGTGCDAPFYFRARSAN